MIPILQAEECKQADSYTMEELGISSATLMERAAGGCAEHFSARYPIPGSVLILAGKGNNGGDGICMGRILAGKGWRVDLCLTAESTQCSPDTQLQLRMAVQEGKINILPPLLASFSPLPETLVIDALFGTGIHSPLRSEGLRWIEKLNQSGAEVHSIDLPSGMPCQPWEGFQPHQVVRAHRTYSLQTPKLTAFLPETAPYFGDCELVDFGLRTHRIVCQNFMIQPKSVAAMIAPRDPFSHKGHYGHALLAAGSHGMMGAAVLAARACLRGGAGLLTVHIPHSENLILQIAVPEAMTHTSPDGISAAELSKFRAIGIGSGLGHSAEAKHLTKQLITSWKGALIADADALNHLAEEPELLKQLPPDTVLTPHPGEFSRLLASVGETARNSAEQIDAQRRFSMRFGVVVLRKGRFSTISLPDGQLFFNTTGNPGMATAGSGDVLAGIVLSLLAQGLSGAQAAIVAAFLHGLAGDIVAEEESMPSLMAGDLCNAIGKAYKKLML